MPRFPVLMLCLTALWLDQVPAAYPGGYPMMQVPQYSSMAYGPVMQQAYQFQPVYMSPAAVPVIPSSYGPSNQRSLPFMSSSPYMSSGMSPMTSALLRALARYLPQSQQTSIARQMAPRPQSAPVMQSAYKSPMQSASVWQPPMSSRSSMTSRAGATSMTYRPAVQTSWAATAQQPAASAVAKPAQVYQQNIAAGGANMHPVKTLFVHIAECDRVGQLLRDPTDKCSYQVCGYSTGGVRPDGTIGLVPRRRPCPSGTAVPAGFTGGAMSPCSLRDATCGKGSTPPSVQAGPALPRQAAAPSVAFSATQTRPQVMVQAPATAGCMSVGQTLRNGADRCSYVVCAAGQVGLVATVVRCPPGSALPLSVLPPAGTPCSQVSAHCDTVPSVPQASSKIITQHLKSFLQHMQPYQQPQPTKAPKSTSQQNPYAALYMPSKTRNNQQSTLNVIQASTGGQCQVSGQFMRDPSDRCRYLVCSGPAVPTVERPMVVTSAPCPPGTSVPPAFQSGQSVPCTILDNTCTSKSSSSPSQDFQPSQQQIKPQLPSTVTRDKPAAQYQPNGQCQTLGQYVRMPTDRCSYAVCTSASPTADGVTTLFPQQSPCAPGTAVPQNFVSGSAKTSPCSLIDKSC